MEIQDEQKKKRQERYAVNKEILLAKNKAYNELHRDKILQQNKERYAANKEAINAKRREEYKNNPELAKQMADKAKEYAKANKEKVAARNKIYREKNKETVRNNLHNYRARKTDAFIETVKFSIVFENDKGICYLCKKKVSTELLDGGAIPSNYGTLDHVIPLNKGGLHCYDNIRLACRDCNSSKSDFIPTEGIQMNLFAQPGHTQRKPKPTPEEIFARKKAYMEKYHEKNKERLKAKAKALIESRRPADYVKPEPLTTPDMSEQEKKSIYQKKYHDKNREEINKRHRERRAENKAKGITEKRPSKEKGIEYSKAYRGRNREEINARRARNRAAKREAQLKDLETK